MQEDLLEFLVDLGKVGPPTDSWTVADARKWLMARLDLGVTCCTCGQNAEVWERHIDLSMAVHLTLLYRLSKENGFEEKFFHKNELFERVRYTASSLGGGGFAALALWGLIEQMPKTKAIGKGKTSGFWQITFKGRQFVEGAIQVPKYVRVYNRSLLEFRGEDVSLQDCFDDPFDFERLMEHPALQFTVASGKRH